MRYYYPFLTENEFWRWFPLGTCVLGPFVWAPLFHFPLHDVYGLQSYDRRRKILAVACL